MSKKSILTKFPLEGHKWEHLVVILYIMESLSRPIPRPPKLPALSEEKLQSALTTKWNSNEKKIKLKLKFYSILFLNKEKDFASISFSIIFFPFCYIPFCSYSIINFTVIVRLLYVEVLFVANLPALVMLHRGIWTFTWPFVLN